MIHLTLILSRVRILIESESQEDDFTARDAFFLGAAMGFAYEEGLKKRKRRKRKRFRDDSD